MNKRIQELAEQAWDTPINEMGDVVSEDGQYSWDFHRATEKFAEMIVQECISVINRRFMGDLNREDMEVRRCIEDVQEHFGVE